MTLKTGRPHVFGKCLPKSLPTQPRHCLGSGHHVKIIIMTSWCWCWWWSSLSWQWRWWSRPPSFCDAASRIPTQTRFSSWPASSSAYQTDMIKLIIKKSAQNTWLARIVGPWSEVSRPLAETNSREARALIGSITIWNIESSENFRIS